MYLGHCNYYKTAIYNLVKGIMRSKFQIEGIYLQLNAFTKQPQSCTKTLIALQIFTHREYLQRNPEKHERN